MFVNRNPRPLKHSNLGLVNSLSSVRYFELSDFHIICRIGGATMESLLLLISIYCSPKGHAGAGRTPVCQNAPSKPKSYDMKVLLEHFGLRL
jgi:hypothetical protein